MSDTPLKLTNISGEWEYIPMTAEEIAQLEKDRREQEALIRAEDEARQAREEARQSAIQKLIDLGLTEEQALALAK